MSGWGPISPDTLIRLHLGSSPYVTSPTAQTLAGIKAINFCESCSPSQPVDNPTEVCGWRWQTGPQMTLIPPATGVANPRRHGVGERREGGQTSSDEKSWNMAGVLCKHFLLSLTVSYLSLRRSAQNFVAKVRSILAHGTKCLHQ